MKKQQNNSTHARALPLQSALDGFDPNANGTINVVVVQPDGKILIGGEFSSVQVSTFSSYFLDLPFGVWGGSDDSGSPKF